MLRKISQIGTPLALDDLISGHKGIFSGQEVNFLKALSRYLPSEYVYLTSSGRAAFYIILQALKKLSSKKEVILPAYTAPSVVLPVLKAGLKVKLCDISLSDFNIDLNLLQNALTKETLCVIPAHMFGIPVSGIETLKQKISDIFIVEDCAQSIGSKIGEKNTGSFCDIGFLSFNRGKNIPTYGGGCVFTDSEKIKELIKAEVNGLKEQNAFFKFTLPFKMMALSLAVRPQIYGALYPLISRFKNNEVPKEFYVGKYSNFQAGVGLSLLGKIDKLSRKRYENGEKLINGITGIKGIIRPTIAKEARPAFNRLPIAFKDLGKREKQELILWKAGFDTSRMYLRPLHRIFDLGYKKDDFPNANYFAEHFLTLPTHPLLTEGDLIRIIQAIKK